MSLLQAKWAQNLLSGTSSNKQAANAADAATGAPGPVMELVRVLSDQRVYREVVWSLKRGLHDARSEFSFIRVRGLNTLAKLLDSAASSEKAMQLFRDSQSYRELQIVPVLFDYTLAPRKRVAKNLDVLVGAEAGFDMESSPTTVEVTLALRVLEGCCLVSSGCRATASDHSAVSELIDFFLAGRPAVQSASLDGLLAVMLDSPANQKEFERIHGLRKIAEMFRNDHMDSDIRLKIAEFIVILISQVLPNTNTGFGIGEGSRTAWMTKWAQQELVEVLGEESREVIDSIIGAGRQKFCDQETLQSVMLGYARELLDLTS